jgi:hypothetical protein
MKNINEVYPDEAKEEASNGAFYGPANYTPLIESMGYKTLLQVDDPAYEGDSRLVLQDDERYGILIFGWGSCSGCDALQACRTMKDIEGLRTEIHNSIKWFESKSECLQYVNNHDWEGDFCWHAEETRQFVAKAKELLV